MPKRPLEMRFDPQTINHLGVKMYSKMPPAMAELVSNAYDADASEVAIFLKQAGSDPTEIIVEDNGAGMSYEDILEKFLMIGRNRRLGGDNPTPKYKRLPTGKKGLGKLALFGLASTILVTTRHGGKLNSFQMNWDDLATTTAGNYRPKVLVEDQPTKKASGTTITLSGIKRVSPFDSEGLADSLSSIFIFRSDFSLSIVTPLGKRIELDNKRKYAALDKEFEWSLPSVKLISSDSPYADKVRGQIITTKKPIAPSTGMRGITLYSRGKLVNLPEFFSDSSSSYFYQYLTGWLSVDFIDLLPEDVISTNRESLNWEHEEMVELRACLSDVVTKVNNDWRQKRKEEKAKTLKEASNIDTERWLKTMPADVEKKTRTLVNILEGDDVADKFSQAVKALHNLVPEYPLLHWRQLHPELKTPSEEHYKKQQYYTAFFEAMKKYVQLVEKKSGVKDMSERDLMGKVFSMTTGILDPMGKYCRTNGDSFPEKTKTNVRDGQQLLSQGIVAAARNTVAHEQIADLRDSDLFSERDCLDMLSLLSHLLKRTENSVTRTP